MPALVCVSAPPSNLLGSNCTCLFSSALRAFSSAAFLAAASAAAFLSASAFLAAASALCCAANALPSSLIANEPAGTVSCPSPHLADALA